MSKDWREVKEKIEKDLDRIMWEEPDEIKMSRLGIFPGGPGQDGQIFGNLFFILCDTKALGWGKTEPAVKFAIEDPEFDLNQCIKLWKTFTVHHARLLGAGDPPKCPYPWLNLGKLWELCQDILETFDSIKTKDEFAELVWSWFNYVNRINRWAFQIFPMDLGYKFPRIEKDDVKEFGKYLGLDITE